MFSAPIKRFWSSLGLRISLWYILGFVGSFVLIGFFARWLMLDADHRADRQEIREEFDQDAARCRQVGSEQFRVESEHEASDAETTLVRLSGPDGSTKLLAAPMGEDKQEIAWAGKQLQKTRDSGWRRIRTRDGENIWQVYAERMPDGCWLQVAKTDHRSQEIQERLGHVLLPVAGLVVVLGLVGATGLTARALSPLRRLIDASRTVINSGDMTARVPARVSGGHELDELNGLFTRMLARNESLIRGMREALDNVAHDLRTPLTRLRSSAEASLRDRSATADSRGEALADAIEESERVLETLRTLMDISEAEHGAMVLHLQTLELAPLAAAAVDLYEYVAEEREVSLRTEIPSGLCARADPIRFQQIISNLLDNAIKYGVAGGVVNITAGGMKRPDGAWTWLTIHNDGPGIPAHDLPRIWDRLYRGDHSRTERGSGLGLSLVKAIVEAHGGHAEVVSKPNEGSSFTILLPSSHEDSAV